MELWIRKTFVALIAVLTLGLYVPPIAPDADAKNSADSFSASEAGVDEEASTVTVAEASLPPPSKTEIADEPDAIAILTEQAKEQAINKLGPKIAQQVEDDFTETILPAMEDVLTNVLTEAGEDEVQFYAITEHPAAGLGERIFHVYDHRTQQDVARFHVRRDNRPQEGYWFNFHYHLGKDNFETHHEIGEIYWNKDIPPKWMT